MQSPPHSPPVPAASPDPDSLPHPITFFLTSAERTRVLRALRAIHPDRSRALLAALDAPPRKRAQARSAP